MDKGAHFYACDFQVHSPRDANWNGSRATTEDERKTYAAELVQACRAKGLDAIAITDHHDFAFFPFVRQAAATEVDPTGKPIPPEHQIVVFPGVELTLSSPPCQALLLLSADFDEAKLPDILTVLAIDETPSTEPALKSVELVSPTVVTNLNDLEAKLSQQKYLKQRFIILPNVTDGGHKTLLREGFAEHYKQMHCVGGYVDGDYEAKTGVGKRNILEGRQQNNGFQPLAVIQTSDARSRDHLTLGAHRTWIKWAEPTAEAIRQACLAKESRLSLTMPELPSIRVTDLTVSHSRFLGRIDLELNPQYNAIIGGRGTGKSTILEYLRWGLCDEALLTDDIDSVQGRRRSLIENTLQAFDGEVHVTFVVNDVVHIVKRHSKKRDVQLRIGNDPFVSASESQIRSLLPIQAYSQKQLSSVGVRIEELRRFVSLPIREDLERLNSEARGIQAKVRSAYGDLARKRELDAEIETNDLEARSLKEQSEALRKGLKGLSADEQTLIEQKPLHDAEEEIIDGLTAKIERVQEAVAVFAKTLQPPAESGSPSEIFNTALVDHARTQFADKLAELEGLRAQLDAALSDEGLSNLRNAINAWTQAKSVFDTRYAAAKTATTANEKQLQQIQATEDRVNALRKAQAEKDAARAALGTPDVAYRELRDRWHHLHEQRRAALQAQCEQFTTLSNGLIKAEIAATMDTEGLKAKLRSTLAGMNIKEDKLDKICALPADETDPLVGWSAVLDELESLAVHSGDQSSPLPATVRLSKVLIESERQRIAQSLSPDKWIDLALAPLDFNPLFFYCTSRDKAEFIDFADASAGQQATALLTVLLNQSGAPLIIDQPEDDIDSRMIGEIVEQLWKSKKKRQLVFASHSANFVVNGDAELVVCCDYVKSGDQTQGKVKIEGAIDMKGVRDEITLVTEGGEQAFRLRKAKYGF